MPVGDGSHGETLIRARKMSYERDIERCYDRYCDRELERLARAEWKAEHPDDDDISECQLDELECQKERDHEM